MHGLASILKQSIESIYQDINAHLQPFHHKTLLPRGQEKVSHGISVLMWTRLSSNLLANHFVPCGIVPRRLTSSTEETPVQSPSLTKFSAKLNCQSMSNLPYRKTSIIQWLIPLYEYSFSPPCNSVQLHNTYPLQSLYTCISLICMCHIIASPIHSYPIHMHHMADITFSNSRTLKLIHLTHHVAVNHIRCIHP